MDRRSTIAALFGRSKSTQSKQDSKRAHFKMNTGLAPYSGTWGEAEAAHLLRRTVFGPTPDQVAYAQGIGLAGTVQQLFTENPLPEPPVNYNNYSDPNVPIGETWVDAPYIAGINLRIYRNKSLRAWNFGLLLSDDINIREKLTLFWHNHFGVSRIGDPRFWYRHISLCRSYAWGNFRDLVKDMTIDPAMLRFLNGNRNRKNAPNENFARELLELFTIGKGPLVGPGDHTNYTEDDILEIARILTGWRDRGHNSKNPNVQIHAQFRANQHDQGTKQLSHRFNNATISNQGDQEYKALIDIIFQQSEVARFISRKLYRWFVFYQIDPYAEVNVIEPMAQMLIDNDYQIKPVLQALLQSQHFFDTKIRGAMIKNPIDYTVSLIRLLGFELPTNLETQYEILKRVNDRTRNMEMQYFSPPDVAGWKAYYQEPGYYRIWINASTLQFRNRLVKQLTQGGIRVNGERLKIDLLEFANATTNVMNINSIIEEWAKLFLIEPLTENQMQYIRDHAIPGLPDFEWTLEYQEYLDDPSRNNKRKKVERKLRKMLQALLMMAEFQLS